MDLFIKKDKQENLLRNKENLAPQQNKTLHKHEAWELNYEGDATDEILERDEMLYDALTETCESFIPDTKTNVPVPPQRYQTPSKGKKGRSKRKEDEARLARMRQEQDIAEVVNHRGMRVVEKWKGTYQQDDTINEENNEQQELKVTSALAFCLSLVPSTAMAEEKYLADHAEDVKEMFRQTLYLEDAMKDTSPQFQNFFKELTDVEKTVLDANLSAMKNLRELMKAKLLTMGVVLNDADYENITVNYMKAEQATPEQMEKANENLSRLKNGYEAENFRLTIKTKRAKKELDKTHHNQDFTRADKIEARNFINQDLQDYKDKLERALHAKHPDEIIGNTRFAVATAAFMTIAEKIDFNEALELADDIQLYHRVSNADGEKKQPLSKEERKRFTKAVERAYTFMNGADKALSNKLVGKDAFLSCSQEEYEKLLLPQLISFDLNLVTDKYREVLSLHPEDCEFTWDKYMESEANKLSLQETNGISKYLDAFYSLNGFCEKNVSIADIKALSMQDCLVKGQEYFMDLPEVQKMPALKRNELPSQVVQLNVQLNSTNFDDFDSIYQKNLTERKAKYAKDEETYKKNYSMAHLDEFVKEHNEERSAYRSKVFEAMQKKFGRELSGNWRFAVATAANYGFANGLKSEDVVDLGISLGLHGKTLDKASPEELKEFTSAMEKVLSYLDQADPALMGIGGTPEQLTTDKDKHKEIRNVVTAAMDMDFLMKRYEYILYKNPEACGLNDETFLDMRTKRDLYTTMNQHVVVMDNAYANKHFKEAVPIEKYSSFTMQQAMESQTKVKGMGLPEAEMKELMAIYGDMFYVRGSEQEGFVPGDYAHNIEWMKERSKTEFTKRRDKFIQNGAPED